LLVIALAGLSVGYAVWSTSLVVGTTVNTGNVDIAWSGPRRVWDTEPDEKDASEIVCSISADEHVFTVTLNEAYPSIHYFCELDIHDTGSVPVHIVDFDFDRSSLPPGTTVELVNTTDPNTGEPVEPILPCAQLHEGDQAWATLHVHLSNEAQQNTQYEFTGWVTGQQWNEADQCGEPPPPPCEDPDPERDLSGFITISDDLLESWGTVVNISKECSYDIGPQRF
jgi:hypothetical protein